MATGETHRRRAGAGAWTPPSGARVKRVRERLREIYGIPLMAPHRHPIAELILTVLSQSTNDRNRDVAFLRLRAPIPSCEQVPDPPLPASTQPIRPRLTSTPPPPRLQ